MGPGGAVGGKDALAEERPPVLVLVRWLPKLEQGAGRDLPHHVLLRHVHNLRIPQCKHKLLTCPTPKKKKILIIDVKINKSKHSWFVGIQEILIKIYVHTNIYVCMYVSVK